MAETKISGIIGAALEDLKTIVDANTIIGTPIETNAGTTIIPVSKISMGLASGGVDYETKKTQKTNFGGGGGSGMQVTPVAFIVVRADGSVEMMNVQNPTQRASDLGYNVASLVDRAPEIFEKLKAMFPKKKKAEKTENDEPANEEATASADDADAEEIITL